MGEVIKRTGGIAEFAMPSQKAREDRMTADDAVFESTECTEFQKLNTDRRAPLLARAAETLGNVADWVKSKRCKIEQGLSVTAAGALLAGTAACGPSSTGAVGSTVEAPKTPATTGEQSPGSKAPATDSHTEAQGTSPETTYSNEALRRYANNLSPVALREKRNDPNQIMYASRITTDMAPIGDGKTLAEAVNICMESQLNAGSYEAFVDSQLAARAVNEQWDGLYAAKYMRETYIRPIEKGCNVKLPIGFLDPFNNTRKLRETPGFSSGTGALPYKVSSTIHPERIINTPDGVIFDATITDNAKSEYLTKVNKPLNRDITVTVGDMRIAGRDAKDRFFTVTIEETNSEQSSRP